MALLELLQRFGPRTAHPHQLATMNRALPGERHQAGLGETPAMQRRRPFGDPAEVADLLTALDRGAIDVTEHHRRDLARRDAGHRLVEQCQPIRNPTRIDREPALGAQTRARPGPDPGAACLRLRPPPRPRWLPATRPPRGGRTSAGTRRNRARPRRRRARRAAARHGWSSRPPARARRCCRRSSRGGSAQRTAAARSPASWHSAERPLVEVDRRRPDARAGTPTAAAPCRSSTPMSSSSMPDQMSSAAAQSPRS